MSSKLFTHYSFDECGNEGQLFERLDEFSNDGKIQYSVENQYVFKIKDLELSDDEIQDLCNFLDSMDVYPYIIEEEEDDDFDDFDDFNESDDDYSGKRYRSNDDYEDDY
jgi:hypothetical protein